MSPTIAKQTMHTNAPFWTARIRAQCMCRNEPEKKEEKFIHHNNNNVRIVTKTNRITRRPQNVAKAAVAA